MYKAWMRAVRREIIDENTVLIHLSGGDTILADAEDAWRLMRAEYRKSSEGPLYITWYPEQGNDNMYLARFVLKGHGIDKTARSTIHEDARKRYYGETFCYDVRKSKMLILDTGAAENTFKDLGDGITEMTVGDLKVLISAEDVDKVKQYNGGLSTEKENLRV
jgi:hypothetical protein